MGCRGRAPASTLVRLAVDPGSVSAIGQGVPEGRAPSGIPVVPDHGRRLPGRGAHLHPDPACVEKAVTRRAIPRALRLAGAADLSAVERWAAELAGPEDRTGGTDMEAGHTR
ncbi:hypothetical protein SAMN05445756_1800 [Kytococcus aerolatus]|uniref:YlxR domain-containing protein n=1 Tax=Kytococcus aerolatus TaxID=592308 RepID=A0A212U2G4_9MICO|nr:hypothetical protein SAMN05445756_1800 [Kytococcus aerolatus]